MDLDPRIKWFICILCYIFNLTGFNMVISPIVLIVVKINPGIPLLSSLSEYNSLNSLPLSTIFNSGQ